MLFSLFAGYMLFSLWLVGFLYYVLQFVFYYNFNGLK